MTETQCVSGRPRRLVLISDADRSEFGDGHERGQKLDAVFHHQTDDVAVADTASLQRMSELVGQCIEFSSR